MEEVKPYPFPSDQITEMLAFVQREISRVSFPPIYHGRVTEMTDKQEPTPVDRSRAHEDAERGNPPAPPRDDLNAEQKAEQEKARAQADEATPDDTPEQRQDGNK